MLLSIPVRAEEAKEAKKCPVSGDTVGGDKGRPVEVTYNGKTYTLCCKSCVRKFNANPEKFIKAQK
jgi:YHS domain-containing protein